MKRMVVKLTGMPLGLVQAEMRPESPNPRPAAGFRFFRIALVPCQYWRMTLEQQLFAG